jgi:hypothetical protein
MVPPFISIVVTVPKSDHVPVRAPPPDAVRAPLIDAVPATVRRFEPDVVPSKNLPLLSMRAALHSHLTLNVIVELAATLLLLSRH